MCVVLLASSLAACGGAAPEPPPVLVDEPVAEPTSTPSSAGGIAPELTRRAQDTLRQRDQIATIVASRPTPLPLPGAELNDPPPGCVTASDCGVWWYKPGLGDHTGRVLLDRHPYGGALDVLDGVTPEGNYSEIGERVRADLASGLASGIVDLMRAAAPDETSYYSDGQLSGLLYSRMQGNIAWESASNSTVRVRVWATFDWDSDEGPQPYVAGAIADFNVVPVNEHIPEVKRYIGRLEYMPEFAGFVSLPILERAPAR